MIHTLFFYTFSCSTILVYGIGLEKTYLESQPLSHFIRRLPALLLDTFLSISVLWYVAAHILLPNNFSYLIPMSVLLVAAIIQMMVSLFFPPLRKEAPGERLFFIGLIFLALSEAVSFSDSLLIVCAGILSLYLTTVILFAIRERIALTNVHQDFKGVPLVLVSLGILFVVLYSADVSWWLVEVFK